MSIQGFTLASPNSGTVIPLAGVCAEIELAGLVAHTSIRQRFHNTGTRPLEALYAFPLPLDAVLLGLDIDIGGRVLHGVVQPKRQARERYEDAIVAGDGAFLLRQLDHGINHMSVGNLLPGENVELRVRYAQVLRWSGDTLRFRLPTVIGPHYGPPQRAGIDAEDAPATAFLVEYPFALTARLSGALAQAEVACPTHPARFARDGDSAILTLGPGAQLDRDVVLTLHSAAPSVWEVLGAPDGEHFAVLGCLNPPADADRATNAPPRPPHALTLLIDCSGSMQGDSIAQARRAMLAILDELDDGDTLVIVRFGSRPDTWTPEPVTIDAATRRALAQRIATMEADLGGTEIMNGLDAAIRRSPPGADVLLVTDGDAHVGDAAIAAVALQGHRIFTVGVGSAVSEKLVRLLAERSGGFCELVTPNEQMAERIVAHARRMRWPPATLALDWHAPLLAAAPLPPACYAGDTVAVPALLAHCPESAVEARLGRGGVLETHAVRVTATSGELAAVLPRLVAWARLPALGEDEATALAVRYQLVSAHTAMLAVLERAADQKAPGLPELAVVPQMLAAGWGGMGRVAVDDRFHAGVDPMKDLAENVQFDFCDGASGYERHETANVFRDVRPSTDADPGDRADFVDIPACLRRPPAAPAEVTPRAFLDWVARRCMGADGKLAVGHLATCRRTDAYRLPDAIFDVLRAIAAEEPADRDADAVAQNVMLALLDWLIHATGAAGEPTARPLRLALRASIDDPAQHERLKAKLAARLAGTTATRWGTVTATT